MVWGQSKKCEGRRGREGSNRDKENIKIYNTQQQAQVFIFETF